MRARVQGETDPGQDSKRHSTRQQQGMRTSVGHADGKNTEDTGNKETLDRGD